MPVLIAELKAAIEITPDQMVCKHGKALIALAEKAMADVHQQLKFIGD